ncbi:MAG: alpha/beta fold hydrolase [Deltaproteobacteria bacterium]|nr:alpha/beta fold hydrolase [Deltaproteobacteria bacterium]
MLVDTKCGRLFVEVRGQGPDLVLWHSLLCDSGMWRRQRVAFEEHYRVVAIDAPGHGRSGNVRSPFTMDDCVDAAVQVLDAVGIESAAWVGLSWGGMVGMRLAARHPARVSALVLLDTSARPERTLKRLAYRPLQVIASRIGAVRPLAKALTPIFFSPHTLRSEPDIVDSFVRTLTRMDPESIGQAVEAVIYTRGDFTPELSQIGAPTLVIVGIDDRATPPDEAEHIAARVPGAGLVRIPDAGHLSALEQPERVNAAILSFLAEGAKSA